MIFLKIVLGLALFVLLVSGVFYACVHLAYPVRQWSIAIREAIRRSLNPRCPSCRKRALQWYDLPFSDASEVRRYRCMRCDRLCKRSNNDVWTARPGRPFSREEMFSLRRPASMMTTWRSCEGGPLGSWYGDIHVGLPGEEWPEHDGVPMLPLCQLRCAEMPYRPADFENVALVCVFVASVGAEVASPHGEKWVLRTYQNLEDLVALSYPGDTTDIRSHPVVWYAADDYPFSIYSLPEELWMDYHHYCEANGRFFWPGGSHEPYMYRWGSRVGGYPFVDAPMTQIREGVQADFVFQIDTAGDFPWLRGPGGSLLFQHAFINGIDTWHVNHRSLEDVKGWHVMSVHLGCELEGLHIHVRAPHGFHELVMSYQGRAGKLRRCNDLRGLVRITTAEMALRFVRLPKCAILSRMRNHGYEIFTKEQYAAQPKWNRLVYNTELIHRFVLDSEAMVHLGVQSAQVEAIEDGFRITRWLYCPSDASSPVFQQIVETVKTDGAYTRSVLLQRP